MGQLHEAVDLNYIVSNYKIQALVETGTGLGSTVDHFAQRFPDLEVYTIESEGEIYLQAVSNLAKYPNVECFFGTSAESLPSILMSIQNKDNVLFWLDAHFPGADFGLSTYGGTEDKDLRLPLESELRLIVEERDVSSDIFVIDDLRVYEDGPFQDGNWADRLLYGGDGIDFIIELLGATHVIARLYHQQGYVVATPKDSFNDKVIVV